MNMRRKKLLGFTLVELTVVIAVIGILTTIGVIAFNSTRHNAVTTTMQSDLRGAASALKQYYLQNGGYPDDSSVVDGGHGLVASGNDTYSYSVSQSHKNYCLTISSSGVSDKFYIGSLNGSKPLSGTCELPQTVVSTVAGTAGVSGNSNGTAGSPQTAKFDIGNGITMDSAGNVIFADEGNNVIRKLDVTTHTVSTIVGSGASGSVVDSSNPLTAVLGDLGGLTFGSDGNLYFIDSLNGSVRKVAYSGGTAGAVSTVVSLGSSSYGPTHIIGDASGNLYLTEEYNAWKVKKIVIASGTLSTAAGTGGQGCANGAATTAATLSKPTGITAAPDGTIYFTDCYSVRKLSAGTVSMYTGNGNTDPGYQDGPLATAEFAMFNDTPLGLCTAPDGTMYVADAGNERIRAIYPSTGMVTTIAGTGAVGSADGNGNVATFHDPDACVVSSDGLHIYVIDNWNDTIRLITLPND